MNCSANRYCHLGGSHKRRNATHSGCDTTLENIRLKDIKR
jgi:hypothetical protein